MMPDPSQPLRLASRAAVVGGSRVPVVLDARRVEVGVAPAAADVLRSRAAMASVVADRSAVLASPALRADLVHTGVGRLGRPLADVTDVKLLNPAISASISSIIGSPDQGLPRGSMTVPISPSADVRDDVIYEDPTQPGVRWYIPRYRVAESGGRYVVALRPRTIDGNTVVDGAVLAVSLERVAAPAVAAAVAAGAKPIPAAITARLVHRVMVNGSLSVLQSLDFREITPTERGLDLVLEVTTLAGRDALYAALSDGRYDASIVLVQLVDVAVPVPPAESSAQWSVLVDRVRADVKPIGPRGEVVHTAVVRPVGPVMDRRLVVDAVRSAPMAVDPMLRRPLPETLKLSPQLLESLRAGRVRPPARYRQASRSVECRLGSGDQGPLSFDRMLHPYVFSAIAAPGTAPGAMAARRVDYQPGGPGTPRRSHVYFQSPTQSHVFCYFPDRFRLGRAASPPRAPMVRVWLAAVEGQDEPVAIADIVLRPVVDDARLEAAKLALRGFLAPGSPEVEFQAIGIPTSDLRLRMVVPGDGPGDMARELAGAQIDLESAVAFQLQLTVPQLQRFVDALCSRELSLLRGNVVAALGGVEADTIEADVRVNDAIGTVLHCVSTVSADGTRIDATLTACVESPVVLEHLSAAIRTRRSGEADRLVVTALEWPGGARPATLAPGTSCHVTARPGEPLAPGEMVVDLVVDQDELTVDPDPSAIIDAILDPRVPPGLAKQITIEAVNGVFNSEPDRPAITALIVEFRGGERRQLTPQAPTAVVTLRPAVDDVLHGGGGSAEYEYRVVIVRGPTSPVVGAWQRDVSATLLITAF